MEEYTFGDFSSGNKDSNNFFINVRERPAVTVFPILVPRAYTKESETIEPDNRRFLNGTFLSETENHEVLGKVAAIATSVLGISAALSCAVFSFKTKYCFCQSLDRRALQY